ncbi:hypothetical protein CBOM_04117 [Ceraceosorus bombacis]|uniref:Uncharacterized protein n=1 Tax=Ceraceosorus bombacis TaxID=401625 RepID=A0A0P1BP47_9BASI|nr:hypothetical protein CBOM_04117 [Ceraceosorus bombacis]
MSAIGSIFRPFQATYRYMQWAAHEKPEIFFSVLIGSVGPVLVVTVPPLRRRYGFIPAEPIPSSFPVPQRAREEVTEYDDE